jgi:hypothetical protein
MGHRQVWKMAVSMSARERYPGSERNSTHVPWEMQAINMTNVRTEWKKRRHCFPVTTGSFGPPFIIR